jgi:tetraacyldisaccharide 4'-kinase
LVGVGGFHSKANSQSESKIQNQKSLAFCALGNPANFFEQLAAEGFEISANESFPDHHYYSQGDVRMLEATARSGGAECLLTTAKDAVKLEGLEFTMPCFVVETEVELNDAEGFRRLVTSS